MQTRHPARDLAGTSSSAPQFSQDRFPKLAHKGKFGTSGFFWTVHGPFSLAQAKKMGGAKVLPSQMAQKKASLLPEVQRKPALPFGASKTKKETANRGLFSMQISSQAVP